MTHQSASTPDSGGRASRRRTVVAAVLATVLAVGLLGGTVALVTRDTSPSGPSVNSSPVLTLSRTSNGSGAKDAAAATVAGGGFGGYQLDGTLGTDTGEGVVVDPSGSTATRSQVEALLAALGAGDLTPVRVDGGWTAQGDVKGEPAKLALDERAGNVWQYVRGAAGGCLSISPGAAPDAAISCDAVATAVAPPADGTSTSPTAAPPTAVPSEPPAISRADLVAQATALFTLVGVTPGTGLQASSGGGVTYLDVPLTVEGLPVVDVTLSVAGDASGLVSASGWLDPSFGTVGKYPLISARAGYDDLLAQPQPAIGLAPYCSDKACPTPSPQKVTAARLAWLTSRTDDHVVLVPAWQYEVDGFYGPAVVAVAPQYLATPTPEPGPIDGSGAATGPSAGSAPGSTGGAEPNPVTTAGPPDAVPPTPAAVPSTAR